MRIHWILPSLFVVIGLVGCSKEEPPAEPEKAPEPPKFAPGPLADHTLAGVGAAVKAPDNLKLTEDGQTARFEAEGFPTVTLEKVANPDGGSGIMSSSGSRRVRRHIKTAAWIWKCESGAPGDYKDAIVALCDSMTPPDNPNMGKAECTIEGLDEKAATAAFAAQVTAAGACFAAFATRDEKLVGSTWSVSMSRTGASTSSAMSTTGFDDEAKTCLNTAFDALKADPALAAEGDYKLMCKAPFSRY